MALHNPLVLWPIKFSATSYVLRVTVDGAAEDLDFPASGTLTSGRSYWMSGNGSGDSDGGEGGVGDLLAMLVATLETHSNLPTVTVEFDSQFRLVVTSDLALTIHWGHANTTLDHAIWGASNGNESTSSGTMTFARRAYGVWRPRQPWQEDSEDRTEFSTGVKASLSGSVYRAPLTNRNKPRQLGWTVLSKARVLEAHGDDAGGTALTHDQNQTDTFEFLWRSAIALGYPIRVLEDETDFASDYKLYSVETKDAPWKRDDQHRLRYAITIDLRLVQPSAAPNPTPAYSPPHTTALPRSDFNATREPTVDDDASRGYSYGSLWVYSGRTFILTSEGWVEIGGASFRKFEPDGSEVYLFYFNGDTDDASGNGHDLTDTSTSEFVRVQGVTGLMFNAAHILVSSASAGLKNTGDYTIQALVSTPRDSGSSGNACLVNAGAATDPTDYDAVAYCPGSSTGMAAYHGSDSQRSASTMGLPGDVNLLTWRRTTSTTKWAFFRNGTKLADVTYTSAPSTSGSNAVLRVGAIDGVTEPFRGVIFALRGFHAARSDADIAADAVACGVSP